MEIKDIKANQGKIDVVGTITEKKEARTFEKFGKQGRVCNATLKDTSGSISLTLWNDEVDQVNVGDKVHISNGWCSEYRDERQLSAGKFGTLEVVEKSQQEVLTNDPGMMQQQAPEAQSDEEGLEIIDDEEELVE